MKKQIIVSEHIWKEGGMYTAFCPEIDVASCGRTVDEAKKNLREALEIYVEETSKMGTLNSSNMNDTHICRDRRMVWNK